MEIDGVTSCMKIREVNENKKQFISLLLLADEQESMVDCYLEKGTMFMKNVDLFVLTVFQISLQTIITTQFMRAVYS